MKPMTLDNAERMLRAARAKAEQLGFKVSIAIVDAHGDLIAMVRMDDAPWRTIPICQGKAAASATWEVPSGALRERWNGPVVSALVIQENGRLIPSKGALPIKRDGKLIGAIGVSGAPAEQDEEIASAGMAVLDESSETRI